MADTTASSPEGGDLAGGAAGAIPAAALKTAPKPGWFSNFLQNFVTNPVKQAVHWFAKTAVGSWIVNHTPAPVRSFVGKHAGQFERFLTTPNRLRSLFNLGRVIVKDSPAEFVGGDVGGNILTPVGGFIGGLFGHKKLGMEIGHIVGILGGAALGAWAVEAVGGALATAVGAVGVPAALIVAGVGAVAYEVYALGRAGYEAIVNHKNFAKEWGDRSGWNLAGNVLGWINDHTFHFGAKPTTAASTQAAPAAASALPPPPLPDSVRHALAPVASAQPAADARVPKQPSHRHRAKPTSALASAQPSPRSPAPRQVASIDRSELQLASYSPQSSGRGQLKTLTVNHIHHHAGSTLQPMRQPSTDRHLTLRSEIALTVT